MTQDQSARVRVHHGTKKSQSMMMKRAQGHPLEMHVRRLHQHTISHDERIHVCGPYLGTWWCGMRLVVPSPLCARTARASPHSWRDTVANPWANTFILHWRMRQGREKGGERGTGGRRKGSGRNCSVSQLQPGGSITEDLWVIPRALQHPTSLSLSITPSQPLSLALLTAIFIPPRLSIHLTLW